MTPGQAPVSGTDRTVAHGNAFRGREGQIAESAGTAFLPVGLSETDRVSRERGKKCHVEESGIATRNELPGRIDPTEILSGVRSLRNVNATRVPRQLAREGKLRLRERNSRPLHPVGRCHGKKGHDGQAIGATGHGCRGGEGVNGQLVDPRPLTIGQVATGDPLTGEGLSEGARELGNDFHSLGVGQVGRERFSLEGDLHFFLYVTLPYCSVQYCTSREAGKQIKT